MHNFYKFHFIISTDLIKTVVYEFTENLKTISVLVPKHRPPGQGQRGSYRTSLPGALIGKCTPPPRGQRDESDPKWGGGFPRALLLCQLAAPAKGLWPRGHPPGPRGPAPRPSASTQRPPGSRPIESLSTAVPQHPTVPSAAPHSFWPLLLPSHPDPARGSSDSTTPSTKVRCPEPWLSGSL